MNDGGRARAARAGTRRAAARGAWGVAAMVLAGGAAACSAEPLPVRGVGAAPTSAPEVSSAAAASTATPAGPQYLLADVDRRAAGTTIALEKGAHGVLLDGARAIASEAGVTFAAETADTPISRVDRVPARLGGGFLFRTGTGLYASATFDGPLRPVVTFADSIASVSFGPDALLVRDRFSRRWSVDLATGARKAPVPMGIVDVAALDDGRAIATTEAGGVSISTDGGKTWKDARSQLQGSAGDVSVREGELWLEDHPTQGLRPLRLERSGALVEMAAMPPLAPPPKSPPRYLGSESPLNMALRSGVRVGPWTAVIGAQGDILRVDLATGNIASTSPGVIPLRMECEALEIPDDVALVCSERNKASVVVTNLLHGRTPRIERSFPADGPFYAGEDGALAFGGPCGPPPSEHGSADPAAPPAPSSTSTAPASPLPTACVRNGEGQWEPFVLDENLGVPVPSGKHAPPSTSASGSGSQGAKVPGPTASATGTGTSTKPPIKPGDVRWVPRVGRAPVAVIATKDLASYDAAWGEIRSWQTEGQARDLVEAARRHAAPRYGSPIVDRRWAATPSGAVQTLLDDGRAIEVSPDGVLTVWPFTFDKVAMSGPRAFAKASGGRAFQTLDRGRTWDEVAAPPSPLPSSFDPRDCSPLGCDLGPWLRIGWQQTPPAERIEVKKIARAPVIQPPPLLEMACLSTGHAEARAAATTQTSPLDLDIGATRIAGPVAGVLEDSTIRFDTRTFGRAAVNAITGSLNVGGETAPRAASHGFGIELEPSDKPDEPFGHIVVTGPARAPSAYRQDFAFVEPFAPSAPIRRVNYTLDTISKGLKDWHISLPELVQWGALDLQAVVPITPVPSAKGRPAGSGDVIATFTPSNLGTLYLVARGGSAPRAEVLFAFPGGTVVSAARLANGDLAALMVNDSNEEVLVRWSGSTVTPVATLPAPPNVHLASANPDAIAIGPKGELAVIRTPSGSEPPSVADPALLIMPGPRLTALAPWASAVSAADPSCGTGSDDAYRATIQTIEPWVRIAGRPVFTGSFSGMAARVRWSASRLCVEALEVPESSGIGTLNRMTESVVIATFGPDDAGRADIEMGSESRASLSCALSPR